MKPDESMNQRRNDAFLKPKEVETLRNRQAQTRTPAISPVVIDAAIREATGSAPKFTQGERTYFFGAMRYVDEVVVAEGPMVQAGRVAGYGVVGRLELQRHVFPRSEGRVPLAHAQRDVSMQWYGRTGSHGLLGEWLRRRHRRVPARIVDRTRRSSR